MTKVKAFHKNACDSYASLLHLAASYGEVNLFHTLLEMGFREDHTNHNQWDILMFAAANGYIDILRAASTKIKPERFKVKDKYARNLFHVAAINGQLDVIKTLMSLKLDILNDVDKYGKTPLHYAAEHNYLKTAKFLVEKCDVNCRDKSGCTPLHLSVYNRCYDIATFLCNIHDVHLNIVNNHNQTPLYLAVSIGSSRLIQLLLGKSVDMNVPDDEGRNIAFLAAINGSLEFLEMFSRYEKFDLFHGDEKGWTVAHYAAQRGYIDMLKFFHNLNPDSIYQLDNQQRSPMMIACIWDQYRCVEWFINLGKPVNPDMDVDIYGNNSLHHAILKGNEKVAQLLLKTREYDVNSRNKNGETVLHLAINRWLMDVISDIIQSGVYDFNLTDSMGRTPLMYACQEGQYLVVQYLINQPHSNFNAVDNNNWSAAHFAAKLPNDRVMTVLYDSNKFRFDIINNKGLRPIDIARRDHNVAIEKFLSSRTDQKKRRSNERSNERSSERSSERTSDRANGMHSTSGANYGRYARQASPPKDYLSSHSSRGQAPEYSADKDSENYYSESDYR